MFKYYCEIYEFTSSPHPSPFTWIMAEIYLVMSLVRNIPGFSMPLLATPKFFHSSLYLPVCGTVTLICNFVFFSHVLKDRSSFRAENELCLTV